MSVILIAYNGDRWIGPCTRTLFASTRTPVHLVLVDNGGNSQLESVPSEGGRIEQLRTMASMGFAEANNFALTRATRLAPFIVFLNQDTVSDSSWIESCLETLTVNPDIGAISPLIRSYDYSDWDPSFLECLSDEQRSTIETSAENSGTAFMETESIPAASMIIRSGVLEKVGPFDPVYGSYYEDYDLCLRIRNAGLRVGFCTSGRIGHYSGSTTDTRAKELGRMRAIIRNRVMFRLRKKGTGRILFMLKQILLEFPRNVLRGLAGRTGSQPPTVVLLSQADIFRLLPRLLSVRLDRFYWEAYLRKLGWNSVFRRSDAE